MASLSLLPRGTKPEGDEEDAEGGDDDDYCNVIGLSYPPMLFEGLHVEDDAHLLKAAVAVLYALALSVDNTLTLVSFERVEVLYDPCREYQLSMTVSHETLIHYEAWNDLFTCLPTRLHGVAIEPFFDADHGRGLLRIKTRILSLLNPIPRTFALLRRRQQSVLLTRLATLAAPLAGPPSSSMLTDVLQAQRDVSAGIHQRQLLDERIKDIRRACSLMTRASEVSAGSYVFDLNFEVSQQRDRILWALPASSALDVSALYKLTNDFCDWIVDATTGLRMQTRPGGRPPLVQVLVTLHLLPVHSHAVTFKDSRLVVYYETPPPANSGAKKKDGKSAAAASWTLAMSGPEFASHYAATTLAAASPPGSDPPASRTSAKKKGNGVPAAADQRPHRRTIAMGQHAPAPSAAAPPSHKRRRSEHEPAEIAAVDGMQLVLPLGLPTEVEEESVHASIPLPPLAKGLPLALSASLPPPREEELSPRPAKRARREVAPRGLPAIESARETPIRPEEDILTQDNESLLRSIEEAEARARAAQRAPEAPPPQDSAPSFFSRLFTGWN
jgi:hypothetical protein